MNNIMDYIDWRGDIGFDQDGINEVDNLILSMVSYLNFDMLRGGQTIEEANRAYIEKKKRGTNREARDFIQKIEKRNNVSKGHHEWWSSTVYALYEPTEGT